MLDAEFAASQVKVFEDDKSRSRQMSYEKWRKRPLRGRFKESLASALAWLL